MEGINHKLLLTRFKESGFKAIELAESLHISRNTIGNVMSGQTSPSHFVIVSLGEGLELTLKEFIAIFFPDIKFKEESTDDKLTD